MDEQVLKRLQDFLSLRNQSTDTITLRRLQQLAKVDAAIQKRKQAITSAQEAIKANAINIQTIASDSGISRKTFYNNELLKEYVESCANLDNEKTRSVKASEYEYLKKQVETLATDLHAMQVRDIKAEINRHDIEQLQKFIEIKDQQIENLNRLYEQAVGQHNAIKTLLLPM